MHVLPTPSAIEAEAKAAGLTLAQLCRKAGIAQSTCWRWRQGTTEPRLDVVRRLLHAVDESAANRDSAVAGSDVRSVAIEVAPL